jgi:hypothetical protein
MRPTFLQQDDSSKSIIQVPEVHARDTTLVIQLSIHVKCLICSNFHLSHPLARNSPLASAFIVAILIYASRASSALRRLELAGPRRAVAVAVPIVVAEQVIASSLAAARNCQRLIYGREEIFRQRRDEGYKCIQMGGGVLGV